MSTFVFGYGSLVTDLGGHEAVLHGARRAWAVAMDNTVDLRAYKHYVDTHGGRPAVSVAFLDLVDDDDGTVDGVCHAVTGDELDALDRRERQYTRVDVTDRVTPAPGRVWAYTGRPESRERATAARRAGTLWIARAYLQTVPPVAVPPDVPVVDLQRIER